MHMRHRLPGGCAVVDADVVAVRMKRRFQTKLRAIEQSQHCLALVDGDVEKRTNVPLLDDERTPGGDEEIVPDDRGELVRENDASRVEGAEKAGTRHGSIL